MLKLLGWNLSPFNFLSENMSFCFFHLHMCIKGFSWIPSDKFRKISPVSLNKAETKPFVRRCFEYESNVTQNLLAGTYSYTVSSTKSWCQLCLVDFCGSAELHHIRGGMLFISLFLCLFLISWLASMCSSKPSLVHHDAEFCVLTCAYAYTVVQFLWDVCARVGSWRGAELLGRNPKGSPHFISHWKQESRLCLAWQFSLAFVEQCWGWRMKTHLRNLQSESLHHCLIFPFYVLYFPIQPDWNWFWILDLATNCCWLELLSWPSVNLYKYVCEIKWLWFQAWISNATCLN